MKRMKITILTLITAVMVTFASAALPMQSVLPMQPMQPVLPVLADEGYTDYSGYTENVGDEIPEPIAAADEPAAQPPAAANESGAEKSGVSFATVFLMFVLAVIINAAVSFVIANRFYKMSRKDSHLQAEIRALRRDINEKFTGSVKEIKETAADVTNTNKNYSRSGGITYKEEEPSGEVSEIAKRWNISVDDAAEPDIKIRTTRRTSARTERDRARVPETKRAPRVVETGGIDADADVSDSVKSKARKFLGDIFPFDEE